MSATIFLHRVRRKKRPPRNARARTCWTPRTPDFNVDVLNQDLQAWMVVFYEHPNQGPFRPQLWNRGVGVNSFFKVNLLRWSFFYGEPGRCKTITWISAQVFALMRHHKHCHSCTYDLHTHEHLRPDAWACAPHENWKAYVCAYVRLHDEFSTRIKTSSTVHL